MIASRQTLAARGLHDDVDTLARTIWGEARGEGQAAMEAIAAVVMNRLERSLRFGGRHWWGATITEICRARLQFPCWNPASSIRAAVFAVDASDADFRLAHVIATRAAAGQLPDPTFGATHYKAAADPWPTAWGHPRLPLAAISDREFFNLRDD